jgi:hypothetical protein
MSVTRRLLARLADRPAFVCTFCEQRFEHDRRHCPACGFDIVARRGGD